MLSKTRLAASFAVLIGVAMSVSLISSDTAAQGTNIDVGNFYFCSNTFEGGVCDTTVAPGTTVTWQVSDASHTVTQCDATFTTCPPPGGFASTVISTGLTFTQTFNTPGTFPYTCLIHPTAMRGRILVQTATDTPTPGATVTSTPIPAPGATTPATQPTTAAGGGSPTPAGVPATGGDSGAASGLLPTALVAALGVSLLAAGAGLIKLRQR